MTNQPTQPPSGPPPGFDPTNPPRPVQPSPIDPSVFSPEHLSIGARLAARPHPSSAHPALNETQIGVLRRIATDADFRSSFVKDPMTALHNAKLNLNSEDFSALARLSPAQYDQLASVVSRVKAESDGTHTLVYAVMLAVAFAVLI